MNVIKPLPIIEWCAFNDRGLSKSEAVKLKENFVTNGQQVTSPSNVFRLLVEPEWIDTVLTPNIAGKSIKDLNEFKTRSGVSLPSKINACGGNHRRHATSLMEAYWKEKEEIAKDVKSQIYPAEKNVELPLLKNAPAEVQQAWKAAHSKLKNIRIRKDQCRYWGVELFSISKSTFNSNSTQK